VLEQSELHSTERITDVESMLNDITTRSCHSSVCAAHTVSLRGLLTIGETLLDYGVAHSNALNIKRIGSRIGRAMGGIMEHMEQVVPMEDFNTICADKELLGHIERLAYNTG
jgi:hypothetical protein